MDAFSDVALKLLEIFSPVILAGLTWVAAKLSALISAKTKNEYIAGALLRLNDAVFTAVKEIEQTVVAGLKEANADGKLTAEEKDKIKLAAIAKVKSHWGMKGIGELAKVLGLEGTALDTLIGAKVEAAVHDLRSTQTALSSAGSSGSRPLLK